MRLAAALTGNLEKLMAEEVERGAHATSYGTNRTVDGLKMLLRQKTLAAFGSQRLANTWRGNLYPRLPKVSLAAAGVVYSNAPHIIEAFSAATTIRSKDGFFLAIPSPDAPKLFNGRRVTPTNWPASRFGDLQFVYRPGKSSLLVATGVRRTKSGRVSRQLANGGRNASGGFKAGVVSVVMFFLVPFVRLKQVFDLEADYDHALDQMVENIIAEWQE